MTSATAIVSPMARPRPSITAPTMPPRLVREHRAADHLPAGGAQAERRLLSLRLGTVSKTSRVSDVMIGMIMMARMRPAVMKLVPLAGPPKSAPRTGMPSTASAIDVVDGLDRFGASTSTPHRPKTTDGHDGQQVDHVDDRLAQPRGARPR